MLCSVQRVETGLVHDHTVFVARIEAADVRPEYWDGKLFCPRTAAVAPYLTFFGTQQFGFVVRPDVSVSHSVVEPAAAVEPTQVPTAVQHAASDAPPGEA
jgi:hypothetical protein